MLGDLGERNKMLPDLSWREITVFAPLLVWAVWIGIYPRPYFDIMERPVAQIVERVRPGYYAQRGLRNPLEAAVSPVASVDRSAPVRPASLAEPARVSAD
jgi:NADH-quinone oxidoreductase subunit M